MIKKTLGLTLSTLLLLNSSAVFAEELYLAPNTYNKLPAFEHLKNDYKFSNQNQVEMSISKAKIMTGNVVDAVFTSDYNSKQVVNSVITLALEKDLRTEEGSLLLPANTIFVGKIDDVKDPKFFHRNAKAHFVFDRAILPTGEELPISATVNTKTGYIGTSYSKRNLKKDAVIVLTVASLGTGLGAIIGLAGSVVGGVVIGSSVGGGSGALAAAVSPGRNLKYKKGEKIRLKFNKDLEVNTSKSK